MAMLLIIEDEAVLARNVARFFEKLGHTVEVAHDGPAGVEAARRVMPDVAIVDFQLPGLDGLEVIGALRKIDAELRCVMVTGHASVPVAIDAMKAGYMDLLTKPVALASLKAVVDRALAERGTRRALDYYQKKEANESSLEALAGDSAPMQALRDLVRTMALSEPADGSPGAPVLVLGETGAGKELVARACHYAGPRAAAPFVEINCAALPAHLIEGELFGHEKGAFTDAQARKIGLIEAADGGTLFLDEIGELDLSLQAKLLRVLENFRVRRLGALQDRLVNVRVVCATNRDLDQLVEAGRFRADLLYRLRVFQINIPPLRARGDDVLLLARRFLAQGGGYTESEIRLRIGLRQEQFGQIARRLERGGYITPIANEGFQIAHPPDQVRVRELLGIGCDLGLLPVARRGKGVVGDALRRLQEQTLQFAGDVTLADLASQADLQQIEPVREEPAPVS